MMKLMGGMRFDFMARERAGTNGRHGRVTLGPVQFVAVHFGVARGDFQRVMGSHASTNPGHGRVALNKVGVMRGRSLREGRRASRARATGIRANAPLRVRNVMGFFPPS